MVFLHKPRNIWIDGTRFTLGMLTAFLAFVATGLTWLFWRERSGILLFSATVLLICSSLYLFWLSWRVGRRRKAAYEARPNKVIPRGSTKNADMNF